MAAPIGISVGDFIAAIQLFKDIASALDEHSGARSHYQHTVRNLETIQAILSRLESFHSVSGQTTQINAIRAQAQTIHNDIQVFLKKIQKFKTTLGFGTNISKRHGIIDKLKWSRKQAREAEKLSRSVDVQLRNIQVLLNLDLSERSDQALQHNQHSASGLLSLPTRHELLSSISRIVDETRVAGRSIGSKVDQTETALLLRLDSLEQDTRERTDGLARAHDLQDLRDCIDARLSSLASSVETTTSARVTLTLTIPRLRLSKEDVALLFKHLSNELEAVVKALSVCFGSVLAFLMLVIPQIALVQRSLRRLPAAISLVLHDNMTFEDALGRLHSLQYQQFRHWAVFKSSLQCIFADTPGLQKILKGQFVLLPEDRSATSLTAANYSSLVRPGYAFKMSMTMEKLTSQASRCPKGCNGYVEKVSVFGYRCKNCTLQYFTGLLDPNLPGNAEFEPQDGDSVESTPGGRRKRERDQERAGLDKDRSQSREADTVETSRLVPSNSALLRQTPQSSDSQDLMDKLERTREFAELKFFKRVHVKIGEEEGKEYFDKFFRLKQELGRGKRGVSLLVEHVLEDVKLGHFVCKRVEVGDGHVWSEKIPNEVTSLLDLSHQNIVSYRHFWHENYRAETLGSSVPCAFILQQYCNSGDLFRYMSQLRRPTEQVVEQISQRSQHEPEPPEATLNGPRILKPEEVYSLFMDIIAGVQYLHQHGYVHGNLKPTNCLLHKVDRRTYVLVSDFGEPQLGHSGSQTLRTADIGWCAPEVLDQNLQQVPSSKYTFNSDIFSLGMILYYMWFADLPYKSSHLERIHPCSSSCRELEEEILSWTGFKTKTSLPKRLHNLLKRSLSVDPHDRPSIEEILHKVNLASRI